mmetsp:Transcript_5006/g.12203  ORF Transcript_5006/g.12203 Transcript_5006/m.12203 type:complete len:367 (-) Transcript_5006:86-1186(-)
MAIEVQTPPPAGTGSNENKKGHKKFANYGVPDWVRHPHKQQPLKVAILFPGEQNHAVGMLRDVRRKPVISSMLDAASDFFGFEIEELMIDGPAADMVSPAVNQPLMYVADCAAFELLKETQPEIADRCQAVAGLGVGEYAALYAAGVITFQQGLEIVKARADALQDLSNQFEGQAILIKDLALERLERHLKTAEKSDREDGTSKPHVSIAQFWCPEGYICAGKSSTVRKLQAVLGSEKGTEVRVLPHSHVGNTPLAETSASKLADLMEKLIPTMKPPRCEVYMNQPGWRVPAGKNPRAFADALTTQLSKPIQWDSCVTQMMNWGIRRFYECGPNRSLKYMMGFYEHVIEAPFEVVKPGDLTENIVV